MQLSAYVVSAFMRLEGNFLPVVGVVFCEQAPDRKMLRTLGFIDIQSMEQANPLSEQPTEPTLYVYQRVPSPAELIVSRIDKDGQKVCKDEKVPGEPFQLIPPLSGSAAERFLNPRSAPSSKDLAINRTSIPESKPPDSAKRRKNR